MESFVSGRYSRQYSVLGIGSLEKITSAKFLLFGCSGIGSEVGKNLLLQGARNLDIFDPGNIDWKDICSGVVFSIDDIGKPRSFCKARLAGFNPDATVRFFKGFDEIKFGDYTAIILAGNISEDLCTQVFDICCDRNIHLVECKTLGLTGRILSFPEGQCTSFKKFCESPLPSLPSSTRVSRDLVPQKILHEMYMMITRFVASKKRYPDFSNNADYDYLLQNTTVELSKDVFERFYYSFDTTIPPMVTLIGGMASFKALSLVTMETFPWNHFYFEAFNLIEDIETLRANRFNFSKICENLNYLPYAGVAALFGKNFQDMMFKLKAFLVGVGATGCENLKLLVQLGVRNISMTDYDWIELSNLSRQFLFREEHIGSPKSVVAASQMMKFRGDKKVRFDAYTKKVPDEVVFPDTFWRGLDVVFSGLDNNRGRRCVANICDFNGLVMLDSGISGLRGHANVHYPHLTNIFKKKDGVTVYSCTLKKSPTKPEHILAWCKDRFEGLFCTSVLDYNSGRKAKFLEYEVKTCEDCVGISVNFLVHNFKVLTDESVAMKFLEYCGILFCHIYGLPDALEGVRRVLGSKMDMKLQDFMEKMSSHLVLEKERKRQLKIMNFDKEDLAHLKFLESACELRRQEKGLEYQNGEKVDLPFIQKHAGNMIPTMMSTASVSQGLLGLEFLLSMNKFKLQKEGVPIASMKRNFRSYKFHLGRLLFGTPRPSLGKKWCVEVKEKDCRSGGSLNDVLGILGVEDVNIVLLDGTTTSIYDKGKDRRNKGPKGWKDIMISKLVESRICGDCEYVALNFISGKKEKLVKFVFNEKVKN